MASTKDTPRQKMIGMMYLVLTALLALNVSKDILKAFVVVNKSLENTSDSFTEKNNQLYAQFDLTKSVDPKRSLEKWQMAQKIRIESASLVSFMETIKKQLIEKTDGLTKSEADTISLANVNSKDNYDTPTNIMIGESEDGSKGLSRELKNKLVSYKSLLTGFIDPLDRSKIDLGINTDDPASGEEHENWEMYHFYHNPLAAVITFLSKMQNDTKDAESVVVDYLLKQLDVDALKFDTVAPKVIPQSNYVLLGEEYKADVFMAAFSKTQNPMVLAGLSDQSPDTLAVERGIGKYAFKTSKEGFVKWGGTINIKSPQGSVLSYPFESEYIVARPALTVSAEKMNVLYMGVDNPISVSVPGVPNERLSTSIDVGKMKPVGSGKFIVTDVSGKKAFVNVSAKMGNGEVKNMGVVEFRVKALPTPVASLANIIGKGKMKLSNLRAQRSLTVAYDANFDFEVSAKIISFEMAASTRGTVTPDLESGSGKLTQPMVDLMGNLRAGDRVFFENIKAVGPDNLPRTLGGITVYVTN